MRRSDSNRVAILSSALSALVLLGCGEANETPAETTQFVVTVESLAPAYPYFASGVFDTPDDASGPGPLSPGQRYSVSFHAAPGMRLSFACMFIPSNDLFFAPAGGGIELFDADGQPRSGDLTAEVQLWDAGTEIDEDLGLGAAQAPSQAAPNTGDADPNAAVRLASESYANLPPIDALLSVSLSAEPGNAFTLTIENVSDDQTLMKTDATSSAVPIAPGVFVIHGEPDPLFVPGEPQAGLGLEALAEDGDPTTLAAALAPDTGVVSVLAPGMWWVHDEGELLFEADAAQLGNGMESLAEDGDPGTLLDSLGADANAGAFGGTYGEDLVPVGPGGMFMFEFEAKPGDHLSFASMFAQSNDLFLAFAPGGVALFDADGTPLSAELGTQIELWDLGTEINEYPGAGPNQAPRQSGPNTGPDEGGIVKLVDDGFAYPSASELVRLTITPQ